MPRYAILPTMAHSMVIRFAGSHWPHSLKTTLNTESEIVFFGTHAVVKAGYTSTDELCSSTMVSRILCITTIAEDAASLNAKYEGTMLEQLYLQPSNNGKRQLR